MAKIRPWRARATDDDDARASAAPSAPCAHNRRPTDFGQPAGMLWRIAQTLSCRDDGVQSKVQQSMFLRQFLDWQWPNLEKSVCASHGRSWSAMVGHGRRGGRARVVAGDRRRRGDFGRVTRYVNIFGKLTYRATLVFRRLKIFWFFGWPGNFANLQTWSRLESCLECSGVCPKVRLAA